MKKIKRTRRKNPELKYIPLKTKTVKGKLFVHGNDGFPAFNSRVKFETNMFQQDNARRLFGKDYNKLMMGDPRYKGLAKRIASGKVSAMRGPMTAKQKAALRKAQKASANARRKK